MANTVKPSTVRMTVDPPLDEVKQRFQQRFKKLSDKSIPYKKAAIFLDRWVQTNFKTEGGNVGGWTPFKYGGRVTPDGIDTSAKLLQDTGRGRASYIPFATRTDVGIGSDVPYMEVHEKGLNGIPQRRTLPKEVEVKNDVREIFVDHVNDAFKDMTDTTKVTK